MANFFLALLSPWFSLVLALGEAASSISYALLKAFVITILLFMGEDVDETPLPESPPPPPPVTTLPPPPRPPTPKTRLPDEWPFEHFPHDGFRRNAHHNIPIYGNYRPPPSSPSRPVLPTPSPQSLTLTNIMVVSTIQPSGPPPSIAATNTSEKAGLTELESHCRDCSTLQATLARVEASEARLQVDFLALSNVNASLRSAAATGSEDKQLLAAIGHKEGIISEQKQLIEAMQAEGGKLLVERNELQGTLNTLNEQYHAAYDQLQKEHQDLQSKQLTYQKTKQLECHQKDLQAAHKKLQAEFTLLNSRHFLRESERLPLETAHKKLQAAHRELQEAHLKVQGEHTLLHSRHSRLESEHDALVNRHMELEIEQAELQSAVTEHTTLEVQHKVLSTRCETIQNEHQSLKNEHEKIKMEHDWYKTRYEEASNAAVVYRAERNHLRLVRDQLQTQIDSTAPEYENREKMLDEKEKTLGRERAKNMQTAATLEKAQREMARLRQDNKDHEHRFADLMKSKKALETQVKEAKTNPAPSTPSSPRPGPSTPASGGRTRAIQAEIHRRVVEENDGLKEKLAEQRQRLADQDAELAKKAKELEAWQGTWGPKKGKGKNGEAGGPKPQKAGPVEAAKQDKDDDTMDA